MIKRWADADERDYVRRHGHPQNPNIGTTNDNCAGAASCRQPMLDNDILLQAYATTLLGADNDLTMHGGGNTSFKTAIIDDAGKSRRALYVKASGTPLGSFIPEYFVAMDLDFLEGQRPRGGIDDEAMAREFKERQLIPSGRLPSIESLMHAFIPARVVDHTHPSAILKIVNRAGGRELLRECFGDDLAVIPYTRMGYDLAKASSEAAERAPGCIGVVIDHHGLITWGDDARAVYEMTIDIITKAESFLARIFVRSITPGPEVSADMSVNNYGLIAPIIKKSLSRQTGNVSLALLNTSDVLALINSPEGMDIICNPPMTPDYPMYTRILPLWADFSLDDSPERISSYIDNAVDKHVSDYKGYLERFNVTNVPPSDLLPQAIVHPRIGAVCFGTDEASARRIADFTRQAFSIRRAIAETGGVYASLPEEHLFDMQYRGYQQAKKNQNQKS
jgi:rhamnose utilization protein RhaD (predicted bifunctional aldolase and dehydrogenase)